MQRWMVWDSLALGIPSEEAREADLLLQLALLVLQQADLVDHSQC